MQLHRVGFREARSLKEGKILSFCSVFETPAPSFLRKKYIYKHKNIYIPPGKIQNVQTKLHSLCAPKTLLYKKSL